MAVKVVTSLNNLHFKQFELFPWPVAGFPCRGLYENSANTMDIGLNSLGKQSIVVIHHAFPRSYVDVIVLVRLPAAVFSLAFRESMPMTWSGCILP
ncbi:hypothetical protein [Sinorhizobium meliloti]|uniref:hypothetical protein n=1 Tax=Rhizobium meliloti TaxID=382 RepID=UPI0012969AA9|nr:hypothetical protein [Sinorhizobium meliloti]MQW58479.1 hypothetical protein [Sinorhizobium meliloti]